MAKFAVTGGSGNYQNVHGYGVVESVSETVSRDTLYLNP